MASPASFFNPAWYLATHPDVRAAVDAGLTTALDHFITYGINEGRSPTPLFDVDFYLAHNPDVRAAVDAGGMSAVAHFLYYGSNEPRQITPFIDLGAYLGANPDVAEAAAHNGLNALEHLLNHGVSEGRSLGNGIELSAFANDPVFQQALVTGNAEAALERVSHVAPFLPSFVPPEGWAPAPDTPIPLDFVPAGDTQLVIPEGIVVPDTTQLPDFIQPAIPEPPMPPIPAPPPEPVPPQDPAQDGNIGRTFAVTKVNGEYVFWGTATGSINLHINTAGWISFSRGGITAKTKLDSSAWASGSDSIRVNGGQTLVISPEHASLPAGNLDCGCDVTGFAIIGAGTVRLKTNTLDSADGITDLRAIAPDLRLDFNRSDTVIVADDNTLFAHPEHLNGIKARGDGTVYVAGDGTGTWSPEYTGDVRGPVTLDIGTHGTGSVITATESDDTIRIQGSGLNNIVPGKGADTVWLETEAGGANIITIEAGAAARYATKIKLHTSYAEEGHQAFIYIQAESNSGEPMITEYRNGAWADMRDFRGHSAPYDDLSPLSLMYGVTVDPDGLVTIIRDRPYEVYAAEQMRASTQEPLPIVFPPIPYGESPFPADSHFWSMDEIHGFTPGRDMIHTARLYWGGNGQTDDPLADAVFSVDRITFNVTDGLASVSDGNLPETDTLQYVLEQLSAHMDTDRRLVAYEHDGDTYLLYGDGVPGLAVSDMVVKLTGVSNLSSIDEILL